MLQRDIPAENIAVFRPQPLGYEDELHYSTFNSVRDKRTRGDVRNGIFVGGNNTDLSDCTIIFLGFLFVAFLIFFTKKNCEYIGTGIKERFAKGN